MQIRFYQHFSSLLCITIIATLLCTSCHRKTGSQEEIVVAHPFANSNWTFEEEVLNLPFEIKDTVSAYRIEFNLTYDSVINVLDELPITITLTAPDGMSTFVTSAFTFDQSINKTITATGHGNECSMTVVAFPKKKLNRQGQYNVKFYRKAAKYDNYGINCLTMHVVPLSNRELKRK